MSSVTISPEARTLIENAYDWLVRRNKWKSGGWGTVRARGIERELEKEELLDRSWRELEEYDERKNDYIEPFRKLIEPSNACLVGGLLVANGYQEDKVLREAERYLAQLVLESQAKTDPDFIDDTYDGWLDDSFEVEDFLINFNDNQDQQTGKRKVMGLFRGPWSKERINMRVELSWYGVAKNRKYYATPATAGRPRKEAVIVKSTKPFATGNTQDEAIENLLRLIDFKPAGVSLAK